jgi:hypothetical protein
MTEETRLAIKILDTIGRKFESVQDKVIYDPDDLYDVVWLVQVEHYGPRDISYLKSVFVGLSGDDFKSNFKSVSKMSGMEIIEWLAESFPLAAKKLAEPIT